MPAYGLEHIEHYIKYGKTEHLPQMLALLFIYLFEFAVFLCAYAIIDHIIIVALKTN